MKKVLFVGIVALLATSWFVLFGCDLINDDPFGNKYKVCGNEGKCRYRKEVSGDIEYSSCGTSDCAVNNAYGVGSAYCTCH